MARPGRRPAHELAATGRPQGRDAIWIAIRILKTFTLDQITMKSRQHSATVRSYLSNLETALILRLVTESVGNVRRVVVPLVWVLHNDVGICTPRVRADGLLVTQGRSQQQMWQAMRIIKRFNYRQLALAASTDDHQIALSNCKSYCRRLAVAQYLVIREPGRPCRPAIYQLVKNTGPKAPMVQSSRNVFDPNLGRVTYSHATGAAP